MISCGLDFGTSNSTVGIGLQSQPVLAPLEGAQTLIPSAIFFDYEKPGQVRFGRDAIDAYVAQHEGRLLRAIKSILSTQLIDQKTAVGGRMMSFPDIVQLFIAHLKKRAEEFADADIPAVVHGRPVHFANANPAADMQAENALRSIAQKAGFRHIEFLYEPIAAAYHYEADLGREELVLVADIGGGTTDFTIIRLGPERRSRTDRSKDILATQGLRLGGTDFDATTSLHQIMPLLGMGSRLREKNLPVPSSVYFELANWPTINFAYAPQSLRDAKDALRKAEEPEKLQRLVSVLEHRLGHRLAIAAEDAKIALSDQDEYQLPLDCVEANLATQLDRRAFEAVLQDAMDRIRRTGAQTIRQAGLQPADIQTVFLTGGSSRVPAVRQAIRQAAPNAQFVTGSDLLSVGLGLTQYAIRLFGPSTSMTAKRPDSTIAVFIFGRRL